MFGPISRRRSDDLEDYLALVDTLLADGIDNLPVEPQQLPMVQVNQFLRRPVHGWFSIERLFDDVRRHLPGDIGVTLVVNRRQNKGLFPRIFDAVRASFVSGEVNHVLGDVHYVAWFLPRKRTVITVLDCIPLERMRGVRRFVLWFLWYWFPLKRASHVTVISEFTRRSLLKWVRYPESKIVVIPPPVSPNFTFSPPRPHEEWSRILQIGSTPNKNVVRLVEAISELPVTLVIIGSIADDVLEVLERFDVSYENHVNVDDQALVQHYRDADILAFPSTYEGWGMPIIEAQAIGRPVVAGNVASMPEAAGGAACLVDPFDVSSMREGIIRVLTDKSYAHNLIEVGLENAKKYEVSAIARRYAGLYRKVSTRAKTKRSEL